MKKELIRELFEKFEQACYIVDDVECWSARELQQLFNYTEWRNFAKVVDKAKEACKNAGEKVADHFVEINKMIGLARGAQREVEDTALTRYACYLVAQNGDPLKNEIAFAQTYFAVQTRKQEIIEQRLLDVERVTAREKLSNSEKKLSGIIFERGGCGQSETPVENRWQKSTEGHSEKEEIICSEYDPYCFSEK